MEEKKEKQTDSAFSYCAQVLIILHVAVLAREGVGFLFFFGVRVGNNKQNIYRHHKSFTETQCSFCRF